MIKRIIYFSLIFSLLLAPVFPSLEIVQAQFSMEQQPNIEVVVIDKDTIWKKDDDLVFDKMVVITDGATLTIQKGANIIFTGPNLGAGIRVLDGNIIANGETNNEITFSGKNKTRFSIEIKSHNKESFFRYVNIDGGGNNSAVQVMKPIRRNLFNTAYAFNLNNGSGLAPLEVNGGKLHIENSEFTNSIFADVKVGIGFEMSNQEFPTNVYLPKIEIVNTNFSHLQAVKADQCLEYKMFENKTLDNCKAMVQLKNNWYGNNEGANSEEGFIVSGDYILDGFKKNKMIVDPVILIPGIMGSAYDTHGELKIDPIWHKYDDLVKSFTKNGFTENKNFFVFPYDWRRSNEQTAILLKYKIKQIKEQTKISKVDIVAHSMGGLVIRSYAEKDDYANNIDQLIFLGAPQKGSIDAYLKWEAGEGFFGILDGLLNRHLNHEAKEKGYNDLGKYVRDKIVSVQELLPDYDYLIDIEKNNELRKYPENYPRNEFLENLNNKDNLAKLENLQIINFVGKDGKEDTISKIKIKKKNVKDKWEHGYPDDFDETTGDRGLVMGKGDGTVPLASAKAINSNIEKEFKSSHTGLPTKTQCEIMEELTADFVDEDLDEEDQVCKYVDKWDIPNMLLFQVFSPIDIQIIAPDGKRVGKNFETGGFYDEIEGAYYTGYKTDTEFITIPNPIDGEYKILTQGTDDGNYKIETTDISEDGDGKVTEKTLTFEGTTSLDEKFQHQLTIENSNILDIKTTDMSDDENIEDSNNDEGVVDENNSEILSENNNEELQLNNNSNKELAIAENNNENSKNNKHKKKKHKKKKKHNKKIALANSKDENNNLRTNYANVNTKKFENKELANNIEKNETKNTVMGEDTTNNKKVSDKQDTINKQNKSWFAFGAVILIGIFLAIGNLFGWLKIKKKKEDKNDF